jgi:hypothetical protein
VLSHRLIAKVIALRTALAIPHATTRHGYTRRRHPGAAFKRGSVRVRVRWWSHCGAAAAAV